jgi:hypothetical protein
MRQDKEIIKEIALRAFKCINIYILLIQKYGQETNFRYFKKKLVYIAEPKVIKFHTKKEKFTTHILTCIFIKIFILYINIYNIYDII